MEFRPLTTAPQGPSAFPGAARPPAPILHDEKKDRAAGGLLAGAAILHLVCVPFSLFVLQAIASGAAGRPVSLDEVWTLLNRAGMGWILTVGIAGQFAFAALAGAGSYAMFHHKRALAVPMLAAGVVALLFSFLLFGGFIGGIAGIASIAGGYEATQRAAPFYAAPPPYVPPRTGPP